MVMIASNSKAVAAQLQQAQEEKTAQLDITELREALAKYKTSDDDKLVLASKITKMYAFAIQVANNDAKWTKFEEDLAAIDQNLGDLFNQKVE